MSDTIAAISTVIGEGGIGIIRMSGDESVDILMNMFSRSFSAGDKENDSNPVPEDHKLTYGHIIDPDTGSHIDEVLVAVMRAPRTYTKEDVVEINCHGGLIPQRKILALCYRLGAVPAEPGEFTKRAFMNGRIDLSQAEAVIDVIKAKTDTTMEVALDQMEGKLSEEIRTLRSGLMDILVNITVNIDYPDEDIEEIVYKELCDSLSVIGDKIKKLISSASTGKILREGLKVTIIGSPNVGKSSLLNALMKESRAIVTDIPGTTRDAIQEAIRIRDIPIVITDTAGIRDTEDKIEQIGIEKSKQSFNEADLVILMLDGSREISPEDRELLRAAAGKNTIILINKSDLENVVNEETVKTMLEGEMQQARDVDNDAADELLVNHTNGIDAQNFKFVTVSAKDGTGISELEDYIYNLVYAGEVSQQGSVTVTNARHEDLLRKSKISIDDAVGIAMMGEPLEIVEIDVHKAYESLGEIIGESVSGDVIDEVFARFCLGK